MRALRPLLPDPADQVYQGEQMRAAVLALPVANGMIVQGDGIVGPETLDGPIPPQWSVPFNLELSPRANAGIMTSLGFVPVYANECMIPRFRQSDARFTLAGVTRDSTNTPLANCTVHLFGGSNEFLGATVSDGSGNYAFSVPNNSGPFFVVAWDVTTGLITGASSRTLSPAEV